MKTQQALIAALREAFPGESDAAIARRAKLSQQRFSNYAQALRTMDDDAVIGCAGLVGWDAKKTLASHHAETAKTDRERAFWRQLAAAAMLATVAIFPSAPASAKSLQVIDSATSVRDECILCNNAMAVPPATLRIERFVTFDRRPHTRNLSPAVFSR